MFDYFTILWADLFYFFCPVWGGGVNVIGLSLCCDLLMFKSKKTNKQKIA